MKRIWILITVCLANSLSLNAQAPPPDPTLRAFMNRVIQEYVAAKADLRQASRQTEAPSNLNTSTAVTDRAAASALVSTAMNLAGMGTSFGGDRPEANSAAVTASAYSLYAAAKGADPLDSGFYTSHPNWRRFWITLGYEDPTTEAGEGGRTKLVGLKALFLNQREISGENVQRLLPSLSSAAAQFGQLQTRIMASIFEHPDVIEIFGRTSLRTLLQQERQQPGLSNADQARIDDLLARVNQSSDELFVFTRSGGLTAASSVEERRVFAAFTDQVTRNFAAFVQTLGPGFIEELRRLIEQEAEAFVNLQQATIDELQAVQRKPQLALLLTTKQGALDEYAVKFAFDYGLANRISATANGGFVYTDVRMPGGDKRGFDFSGQLEFEGQQRRITGGPDPLRFSLGGQARWTRIDAWTVKGQAKLTLPIAEGIVLPLSLTVDNRTAPVEETDIRGQFGFTIDFARLISAFSSSR